MTELNQQGFGEAQVPGGLDFDSGLKGLLEEEDALDRAFLDWAAQNRDPSWAAQLSAMYEVDSSKAEFRELRDAFGFGRERRG